MYAPFLFTFREGREWSASISASCTGGHTQGRIRGATGEIYLLK